MNLRLLTCLAACFLISMSAARSEPPDEAAGPYAIISGRNVFHLNPVPIPPKVEAPEPELPVIKLSGFLRMGKQIHALFCVIPKDKKEGPSYFNLVPGERSGISGGSLEVRNIRFDQGEVDIVNSGTRETLSLKDDSLVSQSPSSGPPQPSHGGFAGLQRGFHPGPRNVSYDRRGGPPFTFPPRPNRTATGYR